MDNKIKHLEFIQGVINRMASNSFLLKGWSVVVVSALFALSAKDANPRFSFFALVPAIAFWLLDGYFLATERAFRGLYNQVRGKEEKDIDFSMNFTPFLKGKRDWLTVSFSPTIRAFHGAIVACILLSSYFLGGFDPLLAWLQSCGSR